MPGFWAKKDQAGLKQKTPTRDAIVNEANNGLKNKKGSIALARTSVINSATSQFFINLADNGFLDYRNDTVAGYGYAVFGQVTSGMDIVEAIGIVITMSVNGYDDVPREDVVIKKVSIVPAN